MTDDAPEAILEPTASHITRLTAILPPYLSHVVPAALEPCLAS